MKNKSLVIVESPTKAKTIGKILGENYTVLSSMGHLIDLPRKNIGLDMENNFEPEYSVIPGRKKLLDTLKKSAKGIDNVYIATDPDREGEAIGWHIKNRVFPKKKILRVVFHEITPSAVKEAFSKPREFDGNMIEAQIGRRVLDRIVGYFLSPLLWKKIARGLSGGRVQSVALRIIVDRERQITSFVPKEYWEISAELEKKDTGLSREQALFKAKLERIEQDKAEIGAQAQAESLAEDIKKNDFVVSEVKNQERQKNPLAPFITSTMQQEAFNKLKFNSTKTMIIAQQLYEGIDIGSEGPVGIITYMRTDSTHVAPEAIKELRNYISSRFGDEHVPQEPNVYKVKKFAQEAHEAIRPTSALRSPDSIKEYLSPEQYKLYELIYQRFVASQMKAARFIQTGVEISAGKYIFKANGSRMIYPGFTLVYNKEEEQDEQDKQEVSSIPPLEKGEALNLVKLEPSQHFTKPPARFSDSSLVKILEEEGIGRPSTYAPIVSTLILRGYVRRIRGYLQPAELGFKVCDMLVEYFPEIMDVKFTAAMEEELDEIEEGKIKRIEVLNDFYAPFKKSLDFAQQNIKKEVITTEQVCDKCGLPMVVKWGRKGKFLSCSGYPKCKSSKSITTGVKCPQENCGGELIERRSKRGFFYGCSNYPKCTYIAKKLPEDNPKA